jgi:23S rRNA pseudouridine2605 synthase
MRTKERTENTSVSPERLQKYLSRCGIASRRKAETMITAGLVRVNGKPQKTLGTKINSQVDKVEVDGKLIRPNSEQLYLMLNKPKDALCTREDPRGRKTIYELFPPELKSRVFNVGRLDRDTTGLLLLTSDGEWANHWMHPRHEIPKIYRVLVRGHLDLPRLQNLRNGVQLKDKKTQPAQVTLLEASHGEALLEMVITEGMNRQIRRMMEVMGLEVLKLKRIGVGVLRLGTLAPGKYRRLTSKEIRNSEETTWKTPHKDRR